MTDIQSPVTIGELAEQAGVTTATLRYYDDRGLLSPQGRSANGYRQYRASDVERLRFIGRAKQFGCSLEEVTVLLRAWDGGSCAPVQETLRTTVNEKIIQAQQQMADITTFLAQLQRAAADLRGHRPDGPCDDSCGCIAESAVEQSGTGRSRSRVDGLSITARSAVRMAPSDDAGNHGPQDRSEPGSEPDVAVGIADPDIACTLDPELMHDRLADFQAVFAIVRHRSHIPDGVRLHLPRTAVDVGALARLLADEQDCCSFWSFSLAIHRTEITIDVQGPPAARQLVDSLFGIAS